MPSRDLRLFFSSPFDDLEKVREYLFKNLQSVPGIQLSGMERSRVDGADTVRLSLRDVANCDVVVAILAHRYGSIPKLDSRDPMFGDGTRSITHLEISAAENSKKEIWAFIIDDDADWKEPREQDRLLHATNGAESEQVRLSIVALRKLKEELRERHTCRTFKDEYSLFAQLFSKLYERALLGEPPAQQPRIYRETHRLDRAEPFLGRAAELQAMTAWLQNVSERRLLQVCGNRGAGKTSLLAEFCAINKETFEDRSGIVVQWSFYKQSDPNTFLRECASAFLGREDVPEQLVLTFLLPALRDGGRHVFILDGFDAIEGTAKTTRALGEISHTQLRQLLEAIATGLGNTKALIATQFKLQGASFNERQTETLQLDGLKSEEAEFLLRSSERSAFRDMDHETVRAVANSVGNHALTLKLYATLPSLAVDEIQRTLPTDAPALNITASKFRRVLEYYEEHLKQTERDLLSLICCYPDFFPIRELSGSSRRSGLSTSVPFPVSLARSQDQVAGDYLCQRNLVRMTRRRNTECLAAQEHIRTYFRELFRKTPVELRNSARSTLATALDAPVDTRRKPNDFLFSQLSLPQDESVAPYTAWWFNIENYDLNEVTIRALGPKRSSTVLDVGFGGGIGLRHLIEAFKIKKAIGVEASREMLKIASDTFRDQISDRAVELHACLTGTERLNLEDNSVDGAISVNTLYFMSNPVAALKEIHRVIKPGGRIAIGLETEGSMRLFGLVDAGFRTFSNEKLTEALSRAGFVRPQLLHKTGSGVMVVALAEKEGVSWWRRVLG